MGEYSSFVSYLFVRTRKMVWRHIFKAPMAYSYWLTIVEQFLMFVYPIFLGLLLRPFLDDQLFFYLFLTAIYLSAFLKFRNSVALSPRRKWELILNRAFVLSKFIPTVDRISVSVLQAHMVVIGLITSSIFYYGFIFWSIDFMNELYSSETASFTSMEHASFSVRTLLNTMSFGALELISPSTFQPLNELVWVTALIKLFVLWDEVAFLGFLLSYEERGQGFRGVNYDESFALFNQKRDEDETFGTPEKTPRQPSLD